LKSFSSRPSYYQERTSFSDDTFGPRQHRGTPPSINNSDPDELTEVFMSPDVSRFTFSENLISQKHDSSQVLNLALSKEVKTEPLDPNGEDLIVRHFLNDQNVPIRGMSTSLKVLFPTNVQQ